MRYLIPFCTALLIGCSDSPTAPTPLTEAPPPAASQPAPTTPVMPSSLRWDRRGDGCQAQEPPTPLPDIRDAMIESLDDGSVMARWPRYQMADGRNILLYARFVPSRGEYVLCMWDTSDL